MHIPVAFQTVGLLARSNIVMTVAWVRPPQKPGRQTL